MKEDVEAEQPWGRGKSWLHKIRVILLYYIYYMEWDYRTRRLLPVRSCPARRCFVLYKGDS
jgi:hypothetical protein